jgi:hypothetical protein
METTVASNSASTVGCDRCDCCRDCWGNAKLGRGDESGGVAPRSAAVPVFGCWGTGERRGGFSEGLGEFVARVVT